MKQVIILFSVMLLSSMSRAQLQTPLSLVSASGGMGQTTINTKSYIVEWTMGETISGLGTAGNYTMSIGEQQGLSNWPNAVDVAIFKTVQVYPNPANDIIRIDQLPEGLIGISLKDIVGKVVRTLSTSNNSCSVNVADLTEGHYVLTLNHSSHQQTSFKILISKK